MPTGELVCRLSGGNELMVGLGRSNRGRYVLAYQPNPFDLIRWHGLAHQLEVGESPSALFEGQKKPPRKVAVMRIGLRGRSRFDKTTSHDFN